MPGPALIFREVHRLRKFAHELREGLERIPRQLKARQVVLSQAENVYREAQEVIRKLKLDTQKKEGELRDMHLKVQKYEKQTSDISSKKEYDALQSEIASAKASCDRLENEILEALTEVEERTARLPEEEKKLQVAKEEFTRFERELQVRKKDLEEQMVTAQSQLQQVETTIPEELRQDYNRMVGGRGADALATVKDRTCSACYTGITAQMYNELQQQLYMTCKSCGRILYLAE